MCRFAPRVNNSSQFDEVEDSKSFAHPDLIPFGGSGASERCVIFTPHRFDEVEDSKFGAHTGLPTPFPSPEYEGSSTTTY